MKMEFYSEPAYARTLSGEFDYTSLEEKVARQLEINNAQPMVPHPFIPGPEDVQEGEGMALCPSCGAYWQCDCPRQPDGPNSTRESLDAALQKHLGVNLADAQRLAASFNGDPVRLSRALDDMQQARADNVVDKVRKAYKKE